MRKAIFTLVAAAIAAFFIYTNTDIVDAGSNEAAEEATPAGPRVSVELNDLIGSDGSATIGTVDRDKATALIASLETSKAASMKGYDRIPQYGDWLTGDDSSDPSFCGDTRNDVLNRDFDDITYVHDDDCQIATGTLADPYTGETIDFTRGPSTSAEVQIEHIVSLGYTYRMGAKDWTQDKREAIANDPANLIAVDGPANQSKSDLGPEDWMPTDSGNPAYDCTFVARYAFVADKYELPVTPADRKAMTSTIKACENN
ncbi:HNH endonuclease family protein [Brevibacterium antiquum]|uniref:HNH endonuclease family protein n=1 Tax=Brevibacterium antiquum TaxID=234835 RepID=UPI0018DFBBC7|nr:HNH endonuclease family protein [Brevibacterium antiquum]